MLHDTYFPILSDIIPIPFILIECCSLSQLSYLTNEDCCYSDHLTSPSNPYSQLELVGLFWNYWNVSLLEIVLILLFLQNFLFSS